MSDLIWMRLPVPADLAESSLAQALRHFDEYGKHPHTLVCSFADLTIATLLARPHQLRVAPLHRTLMPDDHAWVVMGDDLGIYSSRMPD